MNTIKDFLNSLDHIYIFVFLFLICLGSWLTFHNDPRSDFLSKHTEAILAAITTAAVIKRGDNNLYSDSNNSYTNVENKADQQTNK